MPELPEVEAARRAVEEHCVGKKIVRAVVADDTKVVDGVSRSDFEASVTGKTVVAALRKGKNMWLRLDSPPFPSFQFGMSGAVYIKGVAVTKYIRSAVKDEEEWPSKYSKVFLELADGLELSFTDKRRFAKVRLLQDPASVPPISELGPDALMEPMLVDEFVNSLRKKKTSIKALLLDQSYISGIGNWIADEVLYQAKIHPLQIAANLARENCESLHKCIQEVLEKALEVGADSSQFPSNWIFHSREKKPGKAYVDGKKIEFITAGGRTSAYVPELQKLSGIQSRKASDEQTKGKSVRKPAAIKVSTTKDIKESDSEGDEEKESDSEAVMGEDSDSEEVENKTKGKHKPKKTGNANKETQNRKGSQRSVQKTVSKTAKGQAKVKTDAPKKRSEISETRSTLKKKSRQN